MQESMSVHLDLKKNILTFADCALLSDKTIFEVMPWYFTILSSGVLHKHIKKHASSCEFF